MTSVFGYPGGKTRAVAQLDKELERYFPDVKTIYSPFLGGASFELHCAHERGLKVYGNDLFTPVISFWRALKGYRRGLERSINGLAPLSREKYFSYLPLLDDKKAFLKLPLSTQGALFFVLVKSSFSNSLGHYSIDKSKQAVISSSKFDKAGGQETLDHLVLSNLDAVQFIRRYRRAGMSSNSVLFLDPPYDLSKNNSLYGVNGKMHKTFDHEALRDILGTRSYWMLCYNDTPYIRKLYKGYKIKSIKWKYSLQNHRGDNHTASNEILIVNDGKLLKRVGQVKCDVYHLRKHSIIGSSES